MTTRLTLRDRAGGWRVRWGIGRFRYRVAPGLYAAGRPGPESPVLVSANYKMSFDRLRSGLDGIDAWILVLDTRGINVWCAAGKGTFGTDELVRRAAAVRLTQFVTHRKLIVPQLGATGISAREVRDRSGFRVVYGPVRAEDLPVFLSGGMRAEPWMRQVRFHLADRLVLVPMELVQTAKYMLIPVALFFVLSGFGVDGYSLERTMEAGVRSALMLLAACLGGAVAAPALLPWIPGRAFSVKGALVGLAAAAVLVPLWVRPDPTAGAGLNRSIGALEASGWLLLIPAVSSFLTMNFTGASTYTSLSGVRREMRLAVPAQIVAAVLGAVFWFAGRFL